MNKSESTIVLLKKIRNLKRTYNIVCCMIFLILISLIIIISLDKITNFLTSIILALCICILLIVFSFYLITKLNSYYNLLQKQIDEIINDQ